MDDLHVGFLTAILIVHTIHEDIHLMLHGKGEFYDETIPKSSLELLCSYLHHQD